LANLEPRRARVPLELSGSRLDAAAAQLFPEFSRSRLQSWIAEGALRVNGAVAGRARQSVLEGDELELDAETPHNETVQAQAIALEVLYTDEHIAILNKPAGLTVHPGAGVSDGTLQNALLHAFPETAQVPRAGIVHRLDKDTSGVLVVARTLAAHTRLVAMIAARELHREYDAIVAGVLSGGGRVEAAIARHPRDRTKMAISEGGRAAVSHYRVAERFRFHTHLKVKLETGRTHQIRVHMAHIKHPIVGDPVYGTRSVRGRGLEPGLREKLSAFPRQALHAHELALAHPVTREALSFSAELPKDLRQLLVALREDAAKPAS
jgi:23S rRNA pseudouridine1911/1915/1917 synthase